MQSTNSSAKHVYCVRMRDSDNDNNQGIQDWQRIAHLSYENNTSQCFQSLIDTEDDRCVQTTGDMPGCSHTVLSTRKMNYS